MRTIVITGTPGTGKTTLAERLRKALKGAEVIRANDIVNEKRLYSRKDRYGTKLVDINSLGREVKRAVARSGAPVVIVEGHLLSDIKIPGAVAVVLREHLPVIRKRLEKRRYPKEKLRDNLVSEATDYCGITASENYKVVYEFFAGDRSTITKIVGIAKGRKPRTRRISLLTELLPLMLKDRKLAS